MIRPLSFSYLLAAVALLAPATSLVAAPINYGNLVGTSFTYQQVTEDSSTDPSVPLFNTPAITGNSITFNNMSFGISTSGGSYDIMDGTLGSTIVSHVPGVGIDHILFNEAGDYTLAGTGTTATNAHVSGAFFVTILATSAGPITPITFNQNLSFSPSSGNYNLIANPGFTQIWNGGVDVNITAILLSHGITDIATQVQFRLDNQLVAFSEPGTIAYIKKKQAGGVTFEAYGGGDIPEPASLSLFACGTVALLLRKRR